MEKNSIFNQTEETVENSEIEKIQSKPVEPKIEETIDESPKLHFKPGTQVVSRMLKLFLQQLFMSTIKTGYSWSRQG